MTIIRQIIIIYIIFLISGNCDVITISPIYRGGIVHPYQDLLVPQERWKVSQRLRFQKINVRVLENCAPPAPHTLVIVNTTLAAQAGVGGLLAVNWLEYDLFSIGMCLQKECQIKYVIYCILITWNSKTQLSTQAVDMNQNSKKCHLPLLKNLFFPCFFLFNLQLKRKK